MRVEGRDPARGWWSRARRNKALLLLVLVLVLLLLLLLLLTLLPTPPHLTLSYVPRIIVMTSPSFRRPVVQRKLMSPPFLLRPKPLF